VADHWLDSSFYKLISQSLPVNQLFDASILFVLSLYLIAALINLKIRASGHQYARTAWSLDSVWNNFVNDQVKLWRDPLGNISLSVTSLFWGVGASMQLLVLAWGQAMLGLNLTQSAYLQAGTAFGVIAGAIIASKCVSLKNAPQVLFVGVLLGLFLPLMTIINDWVWALLLTFSLGMLGGFFVVPMNAMLQARGVKLLSAGRSISVQNTCENSSVLVLLAIYSALVFMHIPVSGLVWALSALIVTGMCLTTWRYKRMRKNKLL
jgi:hypothetical protein